MSSLAYHLFDQVALVTFTVAAPDDAEWEEYSQALVRAGTSRGGLDKLRVIVVTDGGAPNAMQRKRATEYSKGTPPRASVITRSIIARGVVTAFSWFDFPIRAFAPERWSDAFAYAEVVPTQLAVIKRELQRLSAIRGVHLAQEIAQLIPE